MFNIEYRLVQMVDNSYCVEQLYQDGQWREIWYDARFGPPDLYHARRHVLELRAIEKKNRELYTIKRVVDI